MKLRPVAWAQYYYRMATPVFAALDFAAGANLRAVGFAAWPGLRVVYYAVCFACGVVSRARPRWSGPVAVVESTLNAATLVFSVLAPYYQAALDGNVQRLASYPELVVNFVLAGSVATLAFYQALYGLPGALRRIE